MQAFRLTQEMKTDGFSGGTVNCTPAGHHFDVGKALEEGDGMIVTNDDLFAEVLRSYPALERIPDDEVPEGARPVEIPKLEVAAAPTEQGYTPQFPPEGVHVEPEAPPVAGYVPQFPSTISQEPPAEHSDIQPQTEDEAVALGEAVSGLSQGEQPDGGEEESEHEGE